jgi:hypothetical protein
MDALEEAADLYCRGCNDDARTMALIAIAEELRKIRKLMEAQQELTEPCAALEWPSEVTHFCRVCLRPLTDDQATMVLNEDDELEAYCDECYGYYCADGDDA